MAPPVSESPDLGDEIRALYHGPLAGFVAARGALVKRLKGAKDPRKDEVALLRKPPASAWTVNQLFAQEAAVMAALVGAGERARAVQRRAAEGDPAALREALAAIRAEVPRLVGRGVALLAAAERAPGEAVVERLRTNLEALALDPANAPVAARGWLDDDLAPPGFEVMASLQLAAAGGRPAAAAGAPPTGARSPLRAVRNERAGAPPATVHPIEEARAAAVARREREAEQRRERERREREERLERLRAELARAEQEAAQRRAAAERAAGAAAQADREASEAERKAVRARGQAREASLAASGAETTLARVRDALARAEKE